MLVPVVFVSVCVQKVGREVDVWVVLCVVILSPL